MDVRCASYKLFCSAFVKVLFRVAQPLPNKTDDEPGSGSALKPGGVAAVLRPATPLLPPPPPEIQCKQGLQRAAGNTLLMEGV